MDQQEKKTKRVFIACSIKADWPKQFPPGKILTIDNRHLTIVFLGNVENEKLSIIKKAPKPLFAQMPSGILDKIIPLPTRRPKAIAYHANLTIERQAMFDYQQTMVKWFSQHQFKVDDRRFLPHITIARPPFKTNQWHHDFEPMPFKVTGVHLYESLGYRQYQILHSYTSKL